VRADEKLSAFDELERQVLTVTFISHPLHDGHTFFAIRQSKTILVASVARESTFWVRDVS